MREFPDLWRTSTKFERLRCKRGGMLSYARKYAAKQEQKEVPSDYMGVGRFWGVRGDRTRGTCHMVRTVRDGGLRVVREIEALLNPLVEAGYMRKVRWIKGDGWVYFVRGGRMTLYDLGVGQAIDLLLMGAALRG
jgi:hypothetical protein